MYKKLAAVALLLLSSFAGAQMIKSESSAGTMNLYTYQRAGYAFDPALIAFHGLGGRYNDGATLCYRLEQGHTIPYKVFAAQLITGDRDWSKNDIADVFRAVRNAGYRSAHITGVSLGGMAVIRAMAHNENILLIGWPHLEILSAGVVCGKDELRKYGAYAKVPHIMCWHGEDDGIMNVTNIRTMVTGTRLAGGSIELRSFSGVGHDVWKYAYSTTHEESYLNWLTMITAPRAGLYVNGEWVADSVTVVCDKVVEYRKK